MIRNGPGEKNKNRKQKRDKAKKDKKDEKKERKAERNQNSVGIAQQVHNLPTVASNSKIGVENELTNLVSYLFSLTTDLNIEGRIHATNCAIDKYKEKIIANFDLFMAQANAFFKKSTNYDKLKEINIKIHKACQANPNSELNKKKWESSEALIFEGFGRAYFWYILLTKILPELSKLTDVKILENFLRYRILQDLPAIDCLIELFIRNDLISDYYLCYSLLQERCDWALEIGAKSQTSLLLDLDEKIQSGLDTEEILFDSRSLLSCYKFLVIYLSTFREDYTELLNQAFSFSKELVKRAKIISELKSPIPVLEEIKLLNDELESLIQQKKEEQERLKSSSILLFDIISDFYIDEWYSNDLLPELNLKNFVTNVDALILLIPNQNPNEIKFTKPTINTQIIRLLSEYNTMPTGRERIEAGSKVLELLAKVIPYIVFSADVSEKCVALTTVAILKRIEKDIQIQQVELIMLRQKDNNLEQNKIPSEPQAIETEEEVNLINNISSLTFESSHPVDQKLKKQQAVAQTPYQLFEKEIKFYENSYFDKEKKIIEKNSAELQNLQSQMLVFMSNFKKTKKAEFEKKKKQIMQNHAQQMNACKDNFAKEKEKFEADCKAWDKNLRDQNTNELESLENEQKRCQEHILQQIQAHKEQLEIEVQKYRREIAQAKEDLIAKNKEEKEEEEKKFQGAIMSLRQLLEGQNNNEITLMKKIQEKELQEFKLKLDKELPSILEKIKINIKKNHDDNCANLLNTHQDEIAQEKQKFQQIKRDLITHLKNKNQQDFILIKTTQEQELQKLQEEESIILEKIKNNFQQTKKDFTANIKNQYQEKITLIKITQEQELKKLQEEQSGILEKIRIHIQQNHDNNCASLLNTHQDKISGLKHAIAQARKPYESIIGLKPRATISYIPGEVQVILHLLEKHNIENYIFGGYIRDALWADSFLDFDDIDIRVNCAPQDLPPDILACIEDFVPIDTVQVGRIGRVNLVCGELENLKAELLNKDFKINTLICRHGKVYDLLGVYDHLSQPYLEIMKSNILECINEKPAFLLRWIRLSIKLNKWILSDDYMVIHQNAHLIFNLSLGVYLSNLQKLFINYSALEYYRRVNDLGLLHIVIPTLVDNNQKYDGFVILELFWLQKMQEFAHSPRHYDGKDVLALFLLMQLLLRLNEMTLSYVNLDYLDLESMSTMEGCRQYVESNFQNVIEEELIRRFVGFSVADQNLIRRCIPPLIMGNDKLPGLYQQYHHFKAVEFKKHQLPSQDCADVLTPFVSYTPTYQLTSESVQSGYYLNQRNGNFSASVSQNTPQSFIVKRNRF